MAKQDSKVLNFSPWYAHRLFERHTGITPADYIRKFRLSKSALKLRDESCRIADIAFEMGFGSVDSYQRAFLPAAMQESEVLRFSYLETAATSFCLTIHELLDLGRDYTANGQTDKGRSMICAYIAGFVKNTNLVNLCEVYNENR